MRRLVIRPGRDRRFHRFPARPGVPAGPIISRSGPRSRERSAGAIRRSRARHRVHRARLARRDGTAGAADGGTARVRFDRLLVWRQPARVPRAGRAARPAVHFLSGAAAGRRPECMPSDFYLEQVRTLGRRARATAFRAFAAAETAASEDFAVIHPFSGSAAEELAAGAISRTGARVWSGSMPVCWCCRPERSAAARAPCGSTISTNWPAGWRKASLYIGNDSGITHLAAAVGTPVLALFGPTDPAVWAPRGPHVQVGRWYQT